jgi:hypothetical protein
MKIDAVLASHAGINLGEQRGGDKSEERPRK